MKQPHKPLGKDKPKSSGLITLFEILSETAVILLSRINGGTGK